MLSQKHLHDICLIYSGGYKQCRYLEQDLKTYNWNCAKLQKAKKDDYDKKVDEYFAECKKNGLDPKKNGGHYGDNCKGYPIFKFLAQGIDCP